MPAKPGSGKGPRALELKEQGLSLAQIRERLGFKTPQAAWNAIENARQLRDSDNDRRQH